MSAVIDWLTKINQGWKYDPTWREGGFYGERYTRGVEARVYMPVLDNTDYAVNTIIPQ